MGNIKDYIKWRGDLEFWQDGFNIIDNLVLSCVSYVEMDDIFTEDRAEVLSIEEIRDIYFDKIYENKHFRDGSILKDAPIMLGLMADSKRYRNIRVRNYISLNDIKRTLQFAAMEFLLPDSTSYVAYRGTDDTVVGWKEDFMLALKEVEAEKEAVKYINRISKDSNRYLRVGGHSKGGHLAIYAAAKCAKAVQKRIINIYSNDGPGFNDEIANSKSIKDVIPKLISVIPEETIVGLLMNPIGNPIVVKSETKALAQHNLATWCVEGTDLVEAEELSKAAIAIDNMFKENVAKLSEDEFSEYVENIFSALESTGALTLTELKNGGFKTLQAIGQKVREEVSVSKTKNKKN